MGGLLSLTNLMISSVQDLYIVDDDLFLHAIARS